MKPANLIATAASLISAALAVAQETPITPAIESVSLFKNGVAVMAASLPVKGPGVYRWENPPQMIHGTFAIESAAPVAVTSTLRYVERSNEDLPPSGNLAEEVAGSGIAVTLKTDNGVPGAVIKGRVPATLGAPGRTAWDSRFASLREPRPYGYWGYYSDYSDAPSGTMRPAIHGNFLPIDGKDGRTYVSMDSIASVLVTEPGKRTIKSEKTVLLFQVGNGAGPVRFTFLCRGATWAPSYQLDTTNPAKLVIRQQAMVRNEALALAGTDIRLITGFPNIRFATVDSPLTGSPLSQFFTQVSQLSDLDNADPRRANGSMQQVALQNVANNSGAFSARTPEAPSDEVVPTEDLHFHSIGKRDIEEGGALLAESASAEANYEKVVSWEIPDYRLGYYWWHYWGVERQDEFWRSIQNNAWDAVRFQNPFKFPMSGGTATVTDKERFRGQSQVNWTPSGQKATVKTNKALSVNASASEEEIPNTRKKVDYAGWPRTQARFKGTLVMKNLRGEAAKMVVNTKFTGDFVDADANPEKRLRGDGKWFLNPRQELEWQFKLEPNESKTITYTYETIVPN